MRQGRRQFTVDPRTWPIAIKVPLMVVLLMLVVSAVVTDRVLRRLEISQEAHLNELANAYLDGLSALVSPHVLRHDTWEVFDGLERAAGGYGGLDLTWTTVVTPAGSVIASSQPTVFPADSKIARAVVARFEADRSVVVAADRGRAYLKRELRYQYRLIGLIYSEVGIGRLLRERSEVFATLLLTNALLTLILAVAGYALVRWMLRPVKVLAQHIGRARKEKVEPIPAHLMPSPETEFGRLFERYNAMAEAQVEREQLRARLAEEEKLASLGRLTSGIAHEINNPLGGLFNAIDALKKHGESEAVRTTSISLLERGLAGIRDVVRAALHVYRPQRAARQLIAADVEDLVLLIGPELKRKHLALSHIIDASEPLMVAAAPVRDIALNLLLNACAATPEGGSVGFEVVRRAATLVLTVNDGGMGLPEPQRRYLATAGAGKAPIEDRSGLGLWMIRRLADDVGATIAVSDGSGGGSSIEVTVPLSSGQELRHVA